MNKETEFHQISQMEVEYPSEQEIKQQREYILAKAMPKKQSLWEKVKNIYWGPGIKTIFYHCQNAWLVTVFMYIGLCFVTKTLIQDTDTQMALSLLEFPICYLTFSFLSCWLDEQEGVIELKSSMHYSVTYIVGLRMFYASIIIMLCNLCLNLVMNKYEGQYLWKIGAVGVSSMFLFATASLYLYHKLSKSYYIGILIGIWAVMASVAVRLNHIWVQVLLEDIPIAIHGITAVCCFIGLMIYIGKVEKIDAYSFAY